MTVISRAHPISKDGKGIDFPAAQLQKIAAGAGWCISTEERVGWARILQ